VEDPRAVARMPSLPGVLLLPAFRGGYPAQLLPATLLQRLLQLATATILTKSRAVHFNRCSRRHVLLNVYDQPADKFGNTAIDVLESSTTLDAVVVEYVRQCWASGGSHLSL